MNDTSSLYNPGVVGGQHDLNDSVRYSLWNYSSAAKYDPQEVGTFSDNIPTAALEDLFNDSLPNISEVQMNENDDWIDSSLTVTDLLQYIADLNTETNFPIDPWKAVWLAVLVACISTLVYGVYMKVLGDSGMDGVFVAQFRVQATSSLLDSFVAIAIFTLADQRCINNKLRSILCRFLSVILVSLHISLKFSMFLIGITRMAYIIAPLKVYNMQSKTQFKAALILGWFIYFTLFATFMYCYDADFLHDVYYCMGAIKSKDSPKAESILYASVSVNILTALTYISILSLRFKMKFTHQPIRRRGQNSLDLVTCMVQFGMQAIEAVPQIYYLHRDNHEDYYNVYVILFAIIAQCVITPSVLMLLMSFGRRGRINPKR